MTVPTPTPLLVLPRGEASEIRVYRSAREGRQLLHVRMFLRAMDGIWFPTRSAVALRFEELGDLAAGIDVARRCPACGARPSEVHRCGADDAEVPRVPPGEGQQS